MSIEAMKLALEAIQDLRGYRPDIDKAIETLRTAIQQAEAQQPDSPSLQAVCRYISDVLGSEAPNGEKHIARTIMHLLPLEQSLSGQQPATGEPEAWNSIQIASWIGSQLMHEPSMFERATVCKFVRSLGRHPTLLKHSPKLHPAPNVPADVVRDAERYRWLRATTNWASSNGERIDVRNNPELWDSAIDAAMLAASPCAERP